MRDRLEHLARRPEQLPPLPHAMRLGSKPTADKFVAPLGICGIGDVQFEPLLRE
jgi:hypothetical protein